MEIRIKHEDAFIIEFVGRLDTVTSLELQKALDQEEVKEDLVIFDMKETEYISSAGLRLLLSLKKNLTKQGKALEIHNVNDICKEVFKVTGFVNVLTIK